MSIKPTAPAFRVCLASLLLFGITLPVLTQNPAPTTQRPRKVFPVEQAPDDVLRFDTDLVSVDVTATDNEGRPIRNPRNNRTP